MIETNILNEEQTQGDLTAVTETESEATVQATPAPVVDNNNSEEIEEDILASDTSDADPLDALELGEEDEDTDESVDAADVITPILAAPVRSIGQLGTLAVDVLDLVDNKIGADFITDDFATRSRKMLDFKPRWFGADPNSTAYKTSTSISDVVFTSLEMLAGVGLVKNMAKVGAKGALKLGAKESIKAGAKAVNSGSKAAKLAKGAAVGGAEEFLRNPQEENMANMALGMMEGGTVDVDQIDELGSITLANITREDPSLARAAMEFLAVNPKNDQDALNRFQNRLRNSLVGGLTGAALEGAVMASTGLFKAFKANKVLKNSIKDSKEMNKMAAQAGESADLDAIKGQVKEQRFTKVDAKDIDTYQNVINPRIAKTEESIKKIADDIVFPPEVKELMDISSKRALKPNEIRLFEELITKKIKTDTASKKAFHESFDHTGKSLNDILKEDPQDIRAILAPRKVVDKKQADILSNIEKLSLKAASLVDAGKSVPNNLKVELDAYQIMFSKVNPKAMQFDRESGQLLAAVKHNSNKAAKRYQDLVVNSKGEPDYRAMAEAIGNNSEELVKKAGMFRRFDDAIDTLGKRMMLTSIKTSMNIIQSTAVQGGFKFAEDIVTFAVDPRLSGRAPFKALNDAFDVNILKKSYTDMVDTFKKGTATSKVGSVGDLAVNGIPDASKLRKGFENFSTMGQRLIATIDAGVRPISETYSLQREVHSAMTSARLDFEDIKTVLDKTRNKIPLEDAERAIRNRNFNTRRGVPFDSLISRLDGGELTIDKLDDFFADKISSSSYYKKLSSNFADDIAMNRNVQELNLPKTFTSIVGTVSKTPVIRSVVPFPKPMLNAMDKFVERTPILNSFRIAKGLKAGGRKRSEAIAQMAVSYGFTITALGMFQSKMMTSNGPKDFRQKARWLTSNEPLSMDIGGGKRLSLRGTDLEGYLAVAGDMNDIWTAASDNKLGKDNPFGESIMVLSMAMFEHGATTWAEPFKDLLEVSNSLNQSNSDSAKKKLAQFVANYGARVIPAGVKDVRKITDVKRDTSFDKNENSFTQMWSQIKNEFADDIPGLSEQLPARFDMLGRPLEYGNIPMTPVKVTNRGNTTLEKFMTESGLDAYQEVSKGEGLDPLKMTLPQTSINIPNSTATYKLSPEEYSEIQKNTTHPKGRPSLEEALTKIVEHPETGVKGVKSQADYQLLKLRVATTYNNYKKAAREEFKRTSEGYRSTIVDKNSKRIDNLNKEFSLDL